MIEKLSEACDKDNLTHDLASVILRPPQWPQSLEANIGKAADSAASAILHTALISIQQARLKIIKEDLESFKSANSDQKLGETFRQNLIDVCPSISGHHSHINRLMASMERDVNQIEVQKPAKPITTPTHAISSNITDPNEVVMKELKDLRRLFMDFKRDMSHSKSPKPASDPKPIPTKAKESKRNTAKQVSYEDDNEDQPFITVERRRSRSPKNEERVWRHPQERNSTHQKEYRFQGRRSESPTMRNTRLNEKLPTQKNLNSSFHRQDHTTSQGYWEDGRNKKGKGGNRL
jgi:hypothetical protein